MDKNTKIEIGTYFDLHMPSTIQPGLIIHQVFVVRKVTRRGKTVHCVQVVGGQPWERSPSTIFDMSPDGSWSERHFKNHTPHLITSDQAQAIFKEEDDIREAWLKDRSLLSVRHSFKV